MSHVMKALLSNPVHPEYGQITVPFPIPNEEYDRLVEMMETMEIGNALKQDCRVDMLDSAYTVLGQLENSTVSFDELDYLAKRLDSFASNEAEQFQAMAHKLNLTDIRDLINLTFCCQQATVISDFSKLEQAGRAHYLNLNGGCVSSEELANLDGHETAFLLIETGAGVVTPYGVVYDNGMKLEPLYNGRQFPGYLYEDGVMGLELMLKPGIRGGENPEYLSLPASKLQVERTMLRAGITALDHMEMRLDFTALPECVNTVLDMSRETPDTLNGLCQVIERLGEAEKKKLAAVMPLAGPEDASELRRLAENLELFDFVPDVQTVEAYGRYIIQESGMFEYDDNLDEFYNYRLYGEQHIHPDRGQFNAYGYVEYLGTMDLDELLRSSPAEHQEQGLQMGGLS